MENKSTASRRGKLRHMNFLLEFSDFADLQTVASQSDRTIGYCIRAAIRDYLGQHAKTAKKNKGV